MAAGNGASRVGRKMDLLVPLLVHMVNNGGCRRAVFFLPGIFGTIVGHHVCMHIGLVFLVRSALYMSRENMLI